MSAGALLSRLPLPVVLALPAATLSVPVALDPARAGLALALVSTACFLLGAVLARELRQVGRSRAGFSREVARLDRQVSAERLRAAVLEQRVGSWDADAEGSLARTRALLAELVSAEELTRAFIAAELHDTVAQTLSQALQQLRSGDVAPGIDSVCEAEAELRNVLSRLRPPELVDGNLAQAVGDLCRDLEHRYGLVVAVQWPRESVALAGPMGTTAYRFLQETLLNAAVHADGVDVRLDVVVEGDMLIASVTDGGVGFEPEHVSSVAGRHVGLQLVRERARLAGGAVHIRSAPGAGTTVQLHLPLAELSVAPARRPHEAAPRRKRVAAPA